jgi:hypothetical protein
MGSKVRPPLDQSGKIFSGLLRRGYMPPAFHHDPTRKPPCGGFVLRRSSRCFGCCRGIHREVPGGQVVKHPGEESLTTPEPLRHCHRQLKNPQLWALENSPGRAG